MRTILFVCLGNICRSPMAEFIMKKLVKEKGLEKEFHIESCGVSDEEFGENIDYRAKETLDNHNIPYIERHSWKIDRDTYDRFDEIYCMSENHIRSIERICNVKNDGRIKLLQNYEIEDPWYTGRFNVVFEQIYDGCEKLLNG